MNETVKNELNHNEVKIKKKSVTQWTGRIEDGVEGQVVGEVAKYTYVEVAGIWRGVEDTCLPTTRMVTHVVDVTDTRSHNTPGRCNVGHTIVQHTCAMELW